MGRQLRWSLPAVLVIFAAQNINAGTIAPPPSAQFTVDGQSYPVRLEPGPCPDDDSKTCYYVEGGPLTGPGFQLTSLFAEGNPDPQIQYALGVIDTGAPSTFGFVFSIPITPSSGVVFASLGGSLTDGGSDGTSITPASPDMDGDTVAEIQVASVGAPSTNMGVDLGAAASTLGPGLTLPALNEGPVPGPPGVWTTLAISTAFTLAGGGDSAALNGFASIMVPEPSMLVTALTAIAAAAWFVRRRRD